MPWELLLAVWLLFSAIGIGAGVRRWMLHRGAPDWPAVPGTVESHQSRAPDQTSGRSHLVEEVFYSYKVEGEWYSGFVTRQIPYGNECRGLFDQYPRGTQVLVHYDPRHPERSVLDEELTPRTK